MIRYCYIWQATRKLAVATCLKILTNEEHQKTLNKGAIIWQSHLTGFMAPCWSNKYESGIFCKGKRIYNLFTFRIFISKKIICNNFIFLFSNWHDLAITQHRAKEMYWYLFATTNLSANVNMHLQNVERSSVNIKDQH